jgi:hypothetical protein
MDEVALSQYITHLHLTAVGSVLCAYVQMRSTTQVLAGRCCSFPRVQVLENLKVVLSFPVPSLP